MARWSGEMEFEFVEGQNNFVATEKIVQFIRGHLGKGEIQQAAQLYEDKGAGCGPHLLKDLASSSSNSQKALAEMFVMARDFKNAASVFEMARQWDRAAHNYEAGLDFDNAGRLFLDKVNDLPRAAVCFERAGNLVRAVETYKRAGPSQALAEALGRQGHYFDAAAVYRHIFNLKAEIEMLRMVPMTSENRVPATLRLGELLEQYNYPDQAVGLLIETIRGCEHARLHQPMYMQLAKTLEAMGRLNEAQQVRQRIANLLNPSAAAPGFTPSTAVAKPAPAPLEAAMVPSQGPFGATLATPLGHVAVVPHFSAVALTAPLNVPAKASGFAPFASAPSAATPSTAAPSAAAPSAAAPTNNPFAGLKDPFGATDIAQPGNSAYAHLKAIPIFSELDLDDMKELYRACEDLQVPKGFALMEAGVSGRGLFVVVAGSVKVLRADGAELATLGAGSQVGELSLLDDALTSARVVAHDDVTALFISRERFAQFMDTRAIAASRIYRLFARSLSARLRASNLRR